ncbi:MAG: hypothetical protein R2860_17080 [Desulfobacterales bacterium]
MSATFLPCAAGCASIPVNTKMPPGELDDPVAIRAIKRFAADWYFDNIGPKESCS